MTNLIFYFRVVGSESRGILASNSELETLLTLVKLHPQKIRIGVETIGYSSYLKNLGFDSSCIFWSPWPSLGEFNKVKLREDKFRIGFLGCAKQRKGFDNIPKILNDLKSEGLNFNVYVQEANFPCPGYEVKKQEIKSIMGDEFQFLSSNLSLAELQERINECDALILPYDANSYSINASGVMYHACDLSVPVLTASGVGFASEIIKFNLGRTYDKLEEIPKLVESLLSNQFGFRSYNLERNQATHIFLFE